MSQDAYQSEYRRRNGATNIPALQKLNSKFSRRNGFDEQMERIPEMEAEMQGRIDGSLNNENDSIFNELKKHVATWEQVEENNAPIEINTPNNTQNSRIYEEDGSNFFDFSHIREQQQLMETVPYRLKVEIKQKLPKISEDATFLKKELKQLKSIIFMMRGNLFKDFQNKFMENIKRILEKQGGKQSQKKQDMALQTLNLQIKQQKQYNDYLLGENKRLKEKIGILEEKKEETKTLRKKKSPQEKEIENSISKLKKNISISEKELADQENIEEKYLSKVKDLQKQKKELERYVNDITSINKVLEKKIEQLEEQLENQEQKMRDNEDKNNNAQIIRHLKDKSIQTITKFAEQMRSFEEALNQLRSRCSQSTQQIKKKEEQIKQREDQIEIYLSEIKKREIEVAIEEKSILQRQEKVCQKQKWVMEMLCKNNRSNQTPQNKNNEDIKSQFKRFLRGSQEPSQSQRTLDKNIRSHRFNKNQKTEKRRAPYLEVDTKSCDSYQNHLRNYSPKHQYYYHSPKNAYSSRPGAEFHRASEKIQMIKESMKHQLYALKKFGGF